MFNQFLCTKASEHPLCDKKINPKSGSLIILKVMEMKKTQEITKLLSLGDFFRSRDFFLNQLIKLKNKYSVKYQSYSIGQRGPNGRHLFIDVALIGSEEASNMIIISSGTHGVEFYGGAAAQYLYLDELLNNNRKLKKNTKVLLVHAVNPFGAAWLSRFNEDNVDLNRNFYDFSKMVPENKEYQKIAIAFERSVLGWIFYLYFIYYVCSVLPGLLLTLFLSIIMRTPLIFRNGKPYRKLQKAIQCGQ